jgi:hypothetical protein
MRQSVARSGSDETDRTSGVAGPAAPLPNVALHAICASAKLAVRGVNCTEVSQLEHWKQIGTKIGNFYVSVPTLGRVVAKEAKTVFYTY